MGRSGSAPNPNHQQHQQRDYMVEPLGEDGAEQVVDETGDLKKAHHFAALAGSPAAISAIDSAGQHGGPTSGPRPHLPLPTTSRLATMKVTTTAGG
jgi:hypothetical protein